LMAGQTQRDVLSRPCKYNIIAEVDPHLHEASWKQSIHRNMGNRDVHEPLQPQFVTGVREPATMK
jgi:hypothetical protein